MNKAVKVFKILVVIVLVAMIVFLSCSIADAYGQDKDKENNELKGLPLVLTLVVVTIGIIICGANVLLSLVGLIIASVNKQSLHKKLDVIYFVIFMILPVVAEISLIAIGKSLC